MQRAQRDADDVGDGQSGEHHRDRAGLLLRGDQVGRDDRADAEEGAVGERGDDPAGQHHAEGGGEGGEQVARRRTAPISSISMRLRETLVPRTRHQRGADHDAERVAGDQQTGGGDGDAEVGRDLGQQRP